MPRFSRHVVRVSWMARASSVVDKNDTPYIGMETRAVDPETFIGAECRDRWNTTKKPHTQVRRQSSPTGRHFDEHQRSSCASVSTNAWTRIGWLWCPNPMEYWVGDKCISSRQDTAGVVSTGTHVVTSVGSPVSSSDGPTFLQEVTSSAVYALTTC